MIVALAGAWAYENRTEVINFYHRQVIDGSTIRNYFAANSVKKLQLGAGGNNVPGWLNSDINPTSSTAIYLDATATYPFPDNTFHYVFSENMIEHIPWEGGLNMLKESYRVLAPGGKIRVITPNLTKLFNLINHPDSPDVQKFVEASRRIFPQLPKTPIGGAYVFNTNVREWGHVFMYDPATLRKTFELAGFKSIQELTLEDKTDPAFKAVEYRTHENFGDDVWLTSNWGSMVFEATK
jgi:predicted SAM-dependent methyltransferase